MTDPQVEKIVDGLSPKAAATLRDRAWPCPSRLVHHTHRRRFFRQQIAGEGYSRTIEAWALFLTPLGLAVRNHLKGDSE